LCVYVCMHMHGVYVYICTACTGKGKREGCFLATWLSILIIFSAKSCFAASTQTRVLFQSDFCSTIRITLSTCSPTTLAQFTALAQRNFTTTFLLANFLFTSLPNTKNYGHTCLYPPTHPPTHTHPHPHPHKHTPKHCTQFTHPHSHTIDHTHTAHHKPHQHPHSLPTTARLTPKKRCLLPPSAT